MDVLGKKTEFESVMLVFSLDILKRNSKLKPKEEE